MKRVILAVCLLLPLHACTSSAPRYIRGGSGPVPDIRVLLDQTGDPVTVETTGGFQLRGAGGAVLHRSSSAATVVLRRDGTSVQVQMTPGGAAISEDQVLLTPSGATMFRYGGIPYAGMLRVRAYGHSSVLLLNEVALETYLEGVVPYEIGDPGPDGYAAVEAQAIAARTYAMARMVLRRDEPFDVYAGVQDQVYRGTAKSTRLANAAIRDTRGEVIEYNGEMGDAYYSATCAGHTSDVGEMWPQRASRPYLRGVRDAGVDEHSYCADASNFRWRYSFTGRDLGRILHVTLPRELGVQAETIGSFVDLRVVERTRSGRVRVIEIETTGGKWRAEGDRIRWVLMLDPVAGKILPSTMFAIEKQIEGAQASWVSLVGGGNGHGVGMCQNGAIGMARAGYSYRMILSHYYPGTATVKRF